MALIKCPECGNSISDKAEICIHCGYPLKTTEFSSGNELKENQVEFDDEVKKLIDDGMYVQAIKLYQSNTGCSLGEAKTIIMSNKPEEKRNYHPVEFAENVMRAPGRIKCPRCDNYIYDNVLECRYCGLTNISKAIYEKEKKVKKDLEREKEVKCPKCGSKQIQLVQRKWTPIMGINTNKVDRVCMACKKKF